MFPLNMNQDVYGQKSLADTDRRQTYAIEQDTTYKQMTLMDMGLKVGLDKE
ncbi:MAG: hypothetical protein ACLUR5_10055 [Eubacterium ventriosum]